MGQIMDKIMPMQERGSFQTECKLHIFDEIDQHIIDDTLEAIWRRFLGPATSEAALVDAENEALEYIANRLDAIRAANRFTGETAPIKSAIEPLPSIAFVKPKRSHGSSPAKHRTTFNRMAAS